MDLLGGYGSGSDSEPDAPPAAGNRGTAQLLPASPPRPAVALPPAARAASADPSKLLSSLPAPSGSKVGSQRGPIGRATCSTAVSVPFSPCSRWLSASACQAILSTSRGQGTCFAAPLVAAVASSLHALQSLCCPAHGPHADPPRHLPRPAGAPLLWTTRRQEEAADQGAVPHAHQLRPCRREGGSRGGAPAGSRPHVVPALPRFLLQIDLHRWAGSALP